MNLEQREKLQLSQYQEFHDIERLGIQPGTIGIYAPGALGVSLAYLLNTDHFITREQGRTARLFPSETTLTVETEDTGQFAMPANFSHGLVNDYKSGLLPEVIFACPNAEAVMGLVDEMTDLSYEMANDGLVSVDQDGNVRGQENLPIFVIASNGIFDEKLRRNVHELAHQIAIDERTGDQLNRIWQARIIRGSAYVSAAREGFGTSALYKMPNEGTIVLSGGGDDQRQKVIEIAGKGDAIHLKDAGENSVEHEWRKAYTNIMTNVVALLLSVDKRKGNIPRLDIPVGRILNRTKPVTDATYIEIEGAQKWCEKLGQSFFRIAKRKGLFTKYESWKEMHSRMFLDPIKNLAAFYSHIPSSLQIVANQAKEGILADGVPTNETQIISALSDEAQSADPPLDNDVKILSDAAQTIEDNIATVKEVYRRPRIAQPANNVFKRIFNQTGEISYISVHPDRIGMRVEQVRPYVAKAVDVHTSEGEYAIPMTAEVFDYGLNDHGRIAGNIALITNGAGFALESFDRCIEAGVRLGFVSDLRLDFNEGKYYLVMKLALAANPHIDTIAINVLTTLGTSADVARAVEKLAQERPNIKFVVKLEGRDQEEGTEIFQQLKSKGVSIINTADDEKLPPSQIQLLTLDEMVRSLQMLKGIHPDATYAKYEPIPEVQISPLMEFSLKRRITNLLIPSPFNADTKAELELLRSQEMLTPDAIFGREFIPGRMHEALTGKPVVVIAGYGETPRLQAKLMKLAGTEVVLLHPQIRDRVTENHINELRALGISIYTQADELKSDLQRAYPEGVDVIGLSYEPYRPEIENGEVYSERIERSVDQLVNLKNIHGLSVKSILIPSEMVPTIGTKNLLAKCKRAGIWFIGPNSPGMSRTFKEHDSAHLKVAQIPYQCVLPGNIAVAGVGGTMLFETLLQLKQIGKGITWGISLGGDSTRGISARDAALVAENDPDAKYFVYIGETGGNAAQELADVMKAGLVTKPVLVKSIGFRLPENCHIGHTGSVIHGRDFERADVKTDVLQEAGAIITQTPEQIGQIIDYIESHSRYDRINTASDKFKFVKQNVTDLVNRQKAAIASLLQ